MSEKTIPMEKVRGTFANIVDSFDDCLEPLQNFTSILTDTNGHGDGMCSTMEVGIVVEALLELFTSKFQAAMQDAQDELGIVKEAREPEPRLHTVGIVLQYPDGHEEVDRGQA